MPFTLRKPLAFAQCDLTGIGYHPAYVGLLVEVLEAMFASIGAPWPEAMHQRKLGFPTVTLNLEFLRAITYGEVMDFTVEVVKIGRSSVDLVTTVTVGGDFAWRARHRLVQTSLIDHKACPWPEDIRQGLQGYMV